MSKALALWTIAVALLLAMLGLWVITGETGRRTSEPVMTESREAEPDPPPIAGPMDLLDSPHWAP